MYLQHLRGACPAWVPGRLRVSVCVVYDVVRPGPGDIQPRVAPGICLELLVTQRVSRHRILFERTRRGFECLISKGWTKHAIRNPQNVTGLGWPIPSGVC